MKRKLSKEENIELNKLFKPCIGWVSLFTLVSFVILVPVFISIFSLAENPAPTTGVGEGVQFAHTFGKTAGIIVGILLWPACNALIGFPAIHFILKGRLKKEVFQLTDKVNFKQLRMAVFKRWMWQILLAQIVIAVVIGILDSVLGVNTSTASTVVPSIIVMAGVVQLVCIHFYKKDYFSISGTPSAAPVQN